MGTTFQFQLRTKVKMVDLNTKIFVAGHNGMVGSAIVRKLQSAGYKNIITRNREELDLLNQQAVSKFFETQKIQQVYLAAAKVGGIIANSTYPANFIYENLMIQCNVIHSAHLANVQQLLFLGSSCIYPKLAEQPMPENALLTGALEETNEPYAIAKIAGIKLCESYNRQYYRNYRSVMPTNLYGPNDNFHPDNSHVIPALIRRVHEAKINGDKRIVAWGSGEPMREFLYVDDMADASIHVMNLDKCAYDENTEPMQSHINIGTGVDCSIKDLTEIISNVVGYKGAIEWDTSKPDGAPRKLMNVTRLEKLGWKARKNLGDGLIATYKWYLNSLSSYRR